jgi:ATP-dependent helicase/nuclease subunit A
MNVDGLVDAAERQKIRTALTTGLVVEAAAGTGKTSELVERIVGVVEQGLGKLSSIVAVTFTEKAAGEMKLRIRTELDRALSRREPHAPESERLRTAVFELEAAKIGTIHALCADLLRAHPVEAAIDPAFQVADAERARLLLQRTFDGFLADRLADPPEGIRRVLARAALHGGRADPRGALLEAANKLVETRDFDAPFRRDPLVRTALLRDLLAQLEAAAALGEQARDARDPLKRALGLLGRRLRALRGAAEDVQEASLRELARERDIWERRGRGKLFGDQPRAEVLARLETLRAALEQAATLLGADLAACLSRELAPVVGAYEAQKLKHGVLDFFDLLLRARDLLRDVPRVRSELQQRFSHVFVDEFQDTDPVQAEILLLLAADDPEESDPFRARPLPGKLFVVGDPKQSIYRFRRADVTLYERVKRHLLAHGAQLVQLSTSFRSLPGIQSVVNAAFEPLMAGDVERGQAAYVPLAPWRKARPEQPVVIALPAPRPYGPSGRITKKAINESLPDAVAAFLDWLLRRGAFRVAEAGGEVPLEARHVCLLFRRFRSYEGDVTRDYVRALEARRIPHVLSGGRAFYGREEVIALGAVLKAIEWPDDALSVYATLRGPFVAFSDAALLAFKARFGHLSPLRPCGDVELAEQREIGEVLALLRRLHRARNRVPVASTLAGFLSGMRAHAGIAVWPTGEQSLGNVYKLLGLARSYERRHGASSFRGFIAWLEQNADSSGAADASVVEESSDGVRIMTVHAAKGLEFPVVVLCDPTAPKSSEYASRFVDPERKLWAQALCDAEPIELVEQRARVREHDEAELARLSYVAVTRARELLVVPACGDKPIDGWLDVLSRTLFPPRESWRKPLRAGLPGLPAFGPDSVVSWPLGVERAPEDSVAPGEHAPEAGEHRVLWWDPNVLDLQRPPQGGLVQEELLKVDARPARDPNVEAGAREPSVEAGREPRDGAGAREPGVGEPGGNDARGLARYAAFCEARAAATARGAQPSVRMRVVTQPEEEAGAELAPVAVAAVEVLDSGAARALRPSGARFGTLVHALLQHASLHADARELQALAAFLGRGIGASPEEIGSAARDVATALAQPLFERVRAAEARGELFRETPLSVRTPDGSLLEGVVDLAFREQAADGARLVLVDYKTDVELGQLEAYTQQLSRYAQALSQARGEPVECLLLRV